jgi:nucleotide-binding universal stress UspA family protein
MAAAEREQGSKVPEWHCKTGRTPPGVGHGQGGSRLPVEELISAATDANLIVLGSRGAGGFNRLMLGSVAGQVAQHTPCPVTIIPPEDRS